MLSRGDLQFCDKYEIIDFYGDFPVVILKRRTYSFLVRGGLDFGDLLVTIHSRRRRRNVVFGDERVHVYVEFRIEILYSFTEAFPEQFAVQLVTYPVHMSVLFPA